MVKNTYGTGCFMLMNIGDKPVISKNNLITTIAWKIGDKVQYAFEGSIFIAGAVVQWLRDELKIISSAAEIETLASEVQLIVVAFIWFLLLRASVRHIGTNMQEERYLALPVAPTAAIFARAALESIAFQVMEVLKAMESDSGIEIKELRVDGGATQNNLLLQFQADILKATVVRPEVTEVTAIGAAYLAGLAVGFWDNVDQIQKQWQVNRRFEPLRKIGKN